MKKTYLSMALAAAMVLTLLAGCGGSPAPAPASPAPTPSSDAGTPAPSSDATPAGSDATGSVMLYSSMQEEQLIAIKEGFNKKYPNIKMEY